MWLLNVLFQLDWAKGMLKQVVKDWGWFWRRLAFKGVDWLKITLRNAGGHHPTCWETKENKKVEKGRFAILLELAHLSSPALRQKHSGSWAFRLGWGLHHQPSPQYSSLWTQTQTYTTGSSGSQAFGLGLNYITGFPESLVADSRSLDLAATIITWANSCNKSLLI